MLDESDPPRLMGDASHFVLGDAGRAAEQLSEQFLHLYNYVAEQGGKMLLTARRAPSRWDVTLPDLRSRLLALPAVEVRQPEDALIAAVLEKMFSDRQIRVGPGVIDFLVARIERSFATARKMVAVIDEAAMSARRNITVPFVRDVLRSHGIDV
jgi:chromosomal replication initiation ATPase DnaA